MTIYYNETDPLTGVKDIQDLQDAGAQGSGGSTFESDQTAAIAAVRTTANAALPSASFTAAAVTGKLITGFSSGAGAVAATDTILGAIQHLDGNVGTKLATASFTDAAVVGKAITGYSSTTGSLSAADTIVGAISKLNGNGMASVAVVTRTDASLNAAIAMSNALQTIMNAHAADGVIHFHGGATPDIVNFPVAGTASTLANLKTQVGLMLTAYAAHNADAIATTPTYHVLQDTTHALASASAPTTLTECFTRLADLQTKYNLHDAETVAHIAGSTHQSSDNLYANTVGANDYIVAITQTPSAIAQAIPTARLAAGRTLIFKDESGGANTHNITITAQSELIDGASNKLISEAYGNAKLYSDGTNWFAI